MLVRRPGDGADDDDDDDDSDDDNDDDDEDDGGDDDDGDDENDWTCAGVEQRHSPSLRFHLFARAGSAQSF